MLPSNMFPLELYREALVWTPGLFNIVEAQLNKIV